MSQINKKGLSEVIAITIIILLGIIAVSAVYVAVYPIIDLSPEISCAELSLTFPQPIEAKKACYNTATSQAELTIFRQTDHEIKTINFLFSTGEKFYCGEDCSNVRIPEEGETQTYYFSLPYSSGMKLTYGINECPLNNIEVMPSCNG